MNNLSNYGKKKKNIDMLFHVDPLNDSPLMLK